MDLYGTAGPIPEDPESDCLMAYAGPELESVFALEVTEQIFLYGSHNGMIKGFFLHEGELACELAGHRGTIRSLLCVGGGETASTLYSSSADGTVKAWDLGAQEERGSYADHQSPVDCLAHDSGVLVSGSSDGTLKLWSGALQGSLKLEQSLKVHAGNVAAVQLHMPTRSQLECFTASNDGLAKYFDAERKKLIAVYEGCGALRCLQYDPEWNLLYVGGSGKNVMIYDTRVHTCVGQLRGHTDAVLGMSLYTHRLPEDVDASGRTLLKDGSKVLYTAGDDCTVRQWNLQSREEWKLHTNPAALRPGRSPIHEGREDYTFGGHSAGISCIRLTPDGVLYTAGYDASVRVWDREGALDNIEARMMKERQQYEEKQARDRRDRADRNKGKRGKSKGRQAKGKKSSGKKGSDKKKKKKT
eukprot:TRINITY_DN1607_c0_g3_i3.p1 TRINITY_DN1607_c0_g3~~TRINITY_DN1607_c0_g3_i3.p1  ORF type:complete len:415 (+),score=126.81 TRINITY_DN1607_c0_g3_i3:86-1330(+)